MPSILGMFTPACLCVWPQVRGDRVRLRQLPQDHVRPRGLRHRVLLPLQAAVAPQPDLRRGAPAAGPEPAPQDGAVVIAQLQPGERRRRSVSRTHAHAQSRPAHVPPDAGSRRWSRRMCYHVNDCTLYIYIYTHTHTGSVSSQSIQIQPLSDLY